MLGHKENKTVTHLDVAQYEHLVMGSRGSRNWQAGGMAADRG
jgi:hypothetical protein